MNLLEKHKRHADLGVTYTLSASRQLSRDTIKEIERLQARVEALERAIRDILAVRPNWGNEVYQIEDIARAALQKDKQE